MPNVQYIAGGATQNSIRVAQWMLQEAGATAYMGCVGKDANADTMKAECEKAGVNALYMVDPSTPTGSCACCILGKERSLCTNLHAANNYKETHLQEPANWAVASGAKIIYSAGFFITVSPASIKLASREAAKNGNIYCMNLSAPFIIQVPPFKGCLDPYMDCDPSEPGCTRGPCDPADGVPETLREAHPDSAYTVTNVRWGAFGSTTGASSVAV